MITGRHGSSRPDSWPRPLPHGIVRAMNARHGAALALVPALLAACSGAVQSHGTRARATGPERRLPLAKAFSTEAAPPVRPVQIPPFAKPLLAASSAAEGALEPANEAVDARPRMGSVALFSYIYKHPEATGLPLGYIRMGTAVPLRSTSPVEGKGCERGFYAVEPRGYACLNPTTTLDLNDPYYRALQSVAPDKDAVWYYSYAFSNGAPMYSRLPTAEQTAREDQKFGPRGAFTQLAEWSKGHEELIETDPIVAIGPVPEFFAGQKRLVGSGTRNPKKLVWRVIPNGSMVAYARAFEANGRVFLLTPDLMLVPADRVRKLRRSTFHGVPLGGDVALPLAWNRSHDPKPLYRKKADGTLIAAEGVLAAKAFVPIAGESVVLGDQSYFQVRGQGDTFVLAEDVTVSRARTTLPKGVGPREKWIEAKILPGTLTAYEGDRPVMATLFSPGKGGVPVPGLDNNTYATTATGFFPIEWKDHVATMSPDKKGEPTTLWFTDVPHIQYLRAPLALHVAFWHEDFGNPKSAECVNVSPEDGRFLFNWTDPALPEGWGGIRPGGGNGKSTPVIITAR